MKQKADAFELPDFIPYQLAILSNRVSSLIAREYQSRFGITMPEWRIIVVLASADELTATGIAAATRMDKVRVTRTIQSMIKDKLVTRRASQEDGRSTLLTLTKKGRDIYEEIIPMARAVEEDILSPLSGADQKKLKDIINKLSGQLTALEEEALGAAEA